MTPFIWKFFLAQSVQDFDRLAAVEGDDAVMFFCLYYDDHWRVLYQQHHAEIEREWQRRGWGRKQREFVMTPYRERGFVLAHDRRSEEEMRLWKEWEAHEGWKTEAFPEYVARMKERDS